MIGAAAVGMFSYILLLLIFILVYDIVYDYDILDMVWARRSNCRGCSLYFCVEQRYNTDRYLYTGANFKIAAWCKFKYIDKDILIVGPATDYPIIFIKLDEAIDWLLTSPHV